jgi:hypothetical protein
LIDFRLPQFPHTFSTNQNTIFKISFLIGRYLINSKMNPANYFIFKLLEIPRKLSDEIYFCSHFFTNFNLSIIWNSDSEYLNSVIILKINDSVIFWLIVFSTRYTTLWKTDFIRNYPFLILATYFWLEQRLDSGQVHNNQQHENGHPLL